MKQDPDRYRWRARGLVIENQFCLGYFLAGYGPTKQAAEDNFKERTRGFYSANPDKLEFRDRGPAH